MDLKLHIHKFHKFQIDIIPIKSYHIAEKS